MKDMAAWIMIFNILRAPASKGFGKFVENIIVTTQQYLILNVAPLFLDYKPETKELSRCISHELVRSPTFRRKRNYPMRQ